MSWAIVRKGFNTPLLVLDVQFAQLDEAIPEEYKTDEFVLVTV